MSRLWTRCGREVTWTGLVEGQCQRGHVEGSRLERLREGVSPARAVIIQYWTGTV